MTANVLVLDHEPAPHTERVPTVAPGHGGRHDCGCGRPECHDEFAVLAATTDRRARAARRERSIEAHLGLAYRIAAHYRRPSLGLDDIRQVAALALVEAVDRFDPSLGTAFSAFAVPTITGAIKRHFRDQGWALHPPRRVKELRLRIRGASDLLTQRLCHAPGVRDLAEYLDCSQDEVREALCTDEVARPLSIDAPVRATEDGTTLAATMGGPDAGYTRVEDVETLRPLLARLPERELRVVTMRFVENLTQSQIAERLGCSQMHVSRILRATLDRLRRELQNGPTPRRDDEKTDRGHAHQGRDHAVAPEPAEPAPVPRTRCAGTGPYRRGRTARGIPRCRRSGPRVPPHPGIRPAMPVGMAWQYSRPAIRRVRPRHPYPRRARSPRSPPRRRADQLTSTYGRGGAMSSGQVVVVTGASGGIGRAVARRFGARAAKVALLARGEEGLEGAAKDVEAAGGQALPIEVDMAEYGEVADAARRVEEELGPIDVWVNDAFTSVFAPFLEVSPDEYKRVTEVTYLGYVYGTRAALERMVRRDRGTIVQVGSALAYRGIPLQSAYCGAKHAIQGFHDSLRCELLHDKSRVRVTMVQMPAVNTPQFDWVLSRLPRKAQPVPPIYQPELAAQAVVYAADHPRRREYWVGGSTAATLIANKFAAGLLDRYLARTGYGSQQTEQPRDPHRPVNLWQPADSDRPGGAGHDYGAHGRFDERSASRSYQVWASQHRTLVATGAAAAGLGLAWAVRRAWR
jgi:RNA polymerase sigma-70 factor (sigma-B/F/G subfamily)